MGGCLVRTNLGARGELGTGTHIVNHRASRCTVNHKTVGKRLSQYSLCMPSSFFVYCPFGGLQMPMRLVLLRIPNNHLRVSTKPTLFMPCAPTKLHFRWEPAKVRAASINSPTCHPHCKMAQKQCTSHIKDKQTCNNHQQNPIGKHPQGRGERKEERNVANRTKILAKKSV